MVHPVADGIEDLNHRRQLATDCRQPLPTPRCRQRAEGRGVEPGRIGVLLMDGNVKLVHGLGTLGALFLLDLLARRKDINTDNSGPSVTRVGETPSPFPRPTPDDVERFVDDHAVRLARLASAGPLLRC